MNDRHHTPMEIPLEYTVMDAVLTAADAFRERGGYCLRFAYAIKADLDIYRAILELPAPFISLNEEMNPLFMGNRVVLDEKVDGLSVYVYDALDIPDLDDIRNAA